MDYFCLELHFSFKSIFTLTCVWFGWFCFPKSLTSSLQALIGLWSPWRSPSLSIWDQPWPSPHCPLTFSAPHWTPTHSYSRGKQCIQNKLFLKTINSVLEDFHWSAKSYEYGSDQKLCLKCNLLKQDVADIRNFTIIMLKSCNTHKKYTLNKQAKPWTLTNSIIKYCTWYSVFPLSIWEQKEKPHLCSDNRVNLIWNKLPEAGTLCSSLMWSSNSMTLVLKAGMGRRIHLNRKSLQSKGTGLAGTTLVGSPHYLKDFGNACQRSLV